MHLLMAYLLGGWEGAGGLETCTFKLKSPGMCGGALGGQGHALLLSPVAFPAAWLWAEGTCLGVPTAAAGRAAPGPCQVCDAALSPPRARSSLQHCTEERGPEATGRGHGKEGDCHPCHPYSMPQEEDKVLTCAPGDVLAPTRHRRPALPSPAQPGASWASEAALTPATLTQAQPQTAVTMWCQRAMSRQPAHCVGGGGRGGGQPLCSVQVGPVPWASRTAWILAHAHHAAVTGSFWLCFWPQRNSRSGPHGRAAG